VPDQVFRQGQQSACGLALSRPVDDLAVNETFWFSHPPPGIQARDEKLRANGSGPVGDLSNALVVTQ